MVTDDDWLDVLTTAVDRVVIELDHHDDMMQGGERDNQYAFDLSADAAVLDAISGTGAGTFSEESGFRPPSGDSTDVVIIDPVDGSTNASMGIPHYATSLAVRDQDGIRVGLVVNLATGERFEATRGGGARRDGRPISPTSCTDLSRAIVGLTGHPGRPIGWSQFRALGACALDVSYVACGLLDAYADPHSGLGLWDYAAAHLIAIEAGADVGEVSGRELFHHDHEARRAPVYAATSALKNELIAALTEKDLTP